MSLNSLTIAISNKYWYEPSVTFRTAATIDNSHIELKDEQVLLGITLDSIK